MRPIVTDRLVWCVGLYVIVVSPAKTAEPIEMPFGLRTLVGPENHVLDDGTDLPVGRGNFEGKLCPIGKYRDTLRLRLSMQKRLNRSRWRLGYGLGWAQEITR